MDATVAIPLAAAAIISVLCAAVAIVLPAVFRRRPQQLVIFSDPGTARAAKAE